MFFGSCDNSRSEVNEFLNFVELALSCPTPHAETVDDVRKHVGLNDYFEHFTGEIMPDTLQIFFDLAGRRNPRARQKDTDQLRLHESGRHV